MNVFMRAFIQVYTFFWHIAVTYICIFVLHHYHVIPSLVFLYISSIFIDQYCRLSDSFFVFLLTQFSLMVDDDDINDLSFSQQDNDENDYERLVQFVLIKKEIMSSVFFLSYTYMYYLIFIQTQLSFRNHDLLKFGIRFGISFNIYVFRSYNFKHFKSTIAILFHQEETTIITG